jgi:transcriptional regulator with GAF, ATPase, and Fis domain
MSLNNIIPRAALPARPALKEHAESGLLKRHTGLSRENGKPPQKVVLAIAFKSETKACNCEFNGLLSKLLTRFASCEAERVEHELEQALFRVCEFLEIERAGLWCQAEHAGLPFILRHVFPSERNHSNGKINGSSEPSGNGRVETSASSLNGAKSETRFPWMSRQECGEVIVFSNLEQLPGEAQQDKAALAQFGMRSGAVIPFLMENKAVGIAGFALAEDQKSWPEDLVERLKLTAAVLGNGMARVLRERGWTSKLKALNEEASRSYTEIKELKERLQAESKYLKAEMKLSQVHGQIIGQSKAIKQVLRQVEQVAAADCAVLITGETGTGKELIAREIHRLSGRKDRVMVLVNCAALPAALVESELFGREKGAFTGALTSQVGRFEVADGSTIFLDEIGELSAEIQAKLLRVLQDGEFQRLGSPRMHKANVRVIAATNRDLAKEVREGRFRQDLFYRLQVFPINVPPLRERLEDIPLLALSFVEELASRMGKQVNRIPQKLMETLHQHPWQGNIRELRNVIERGIILSPGETLILPNLNAEPETVRQTTTLTDAEREHIIKTLEFTGWRIKGPFGAAKILAVNPSTLYSRMEKLGIRRFGPKENAPASSEAKPPS